MEYRSVEHDGAEMAHTVVDAFATGLTQFALCSHSLIDDSKLIAIHASAYVMRSSILSYESFVEDAILHNRSSNLRDVVEILTGHP